MKTPETYTNRIYNGKSPTPVCPCKVHAARLIWKQAAHLGWANVSYTILLPSYGVPSYLRPLQATWVCSTFNLFFLHLLRRLSSISPSLSLVSPFSKTFSSAFFSHCPITGASLICLDFTWHHPSCPCSCAYCPQQWFTVMMVMDFLNVFLGYFMYLRFKCPPHFSPRKVEEHWLLLEGTSIWLPRRHSAQCCL